MAIAQRHPHLGVEGAVEGELDGIGVELGPVGELDALAQVQGVGEPVVGHIILGGEPRVQLALGILIEEVIVNEIAHVLDQGGGLLLGVEGVRVHTDGDDQLLDVFALGVHGLGCCPPPDADSQNGQNQHLSNSHLALSHFPTLLSFGS